MSRTARAFRTTLVISGFGYAAQALSLVAIPLFLGTVGIGSYGLMVTVMAFTGYLNFADAGLSWGSMILIAQAHGRSDRDGIAHVVRHSAVLAAGSGVIAALGVAAVQVAARFGMRLPMFGDHPESDQLVVIAGIQLVASLQFSVFYGVFQGLQEGYWSGFYQGLGRLLGLALSMVAAWRTHSILLVLLSQTLMTVATGLAAAVHAWRAHPWAFRWGPWFDRSQYRDQFRIGGKTFMIQVGRTLGATAPTMGISSILGPAMVPFYTVPTTLLGLFFMPINSWNSSMQSAYGEAWAANDIGWIRQAFRRTVERAMLVGGLGMAVFIVAGPSFVGLWTHGRILLSPQMTASVCAITMSSTLVTAGEFLLMGLNRHRSASLAEVACGLLSLALVPLSVSFLGLGAVGLGYLVAVAATSAWVLRREILRHVGAIPLPPTNYLARLLASVGLAAGAGLAAASAIPSSGTANVVLRLALGGVSGAAAYALAVSGMRLVAAGDLFELQRRLREMLAFPASRGSA